MNDPLHSSFYLFGFYRNGTQPGQYLITAYGAKPDGVTNKNVTAIQKAIDDAAAAGGGTVMIPRGRFYQAWSALNQMWSWIYMKKPCCWPASTGWIMAGLQASAVYWRIMQKILRSRGKDRSTGKAICWSMTCELRSGEIYDDEWKISIPGTKAQWKKKNRPVSLNLKL